MDLHDFLNVRRTLRMLSDQWNCPVWTVKMIIRRSIRNNWEKAMQNPEEKALWNRYFPNGKPTPEQYILHLGHAYENDETVPFLLKE